MKYVVTDKDVKRAQNVYRGAFKSSQAGALRAVLEHFAQTLGEPVAVPDGWVNTIRVVLTALDKATGDTDPNIDPDMTDDEVRDEYPEIWAMQQLSSLLSAAPQHPTTEKGCD
jgi:hypothetical protein